MMKRESLDSNVILRLMLKDVPEQYDLALALVESDKSRFFVSDTAIGEFVFVLERFYKLTRDQIGEVLNGLFSIKSIDCNRELALTALEYYCEHRQLSYADCYMAASSEFMNAAPLWTFDRDLAAKAPPARLVK